MKRYKVNLYQNGLELCSEYVLRTTCIGMYATEAEAKKVIADKLSLVESTLSPGDTLDVTSGGFIHYHVGPKSDLRNEFRIERASLSETLSYHLFNRLPETTGTVRNVGEWWKANAGTGE